MLPSLTAAFLSGLLLGSLIPFFPISICSLLVSLALGASCCEYAGLLDGRHATNLFGSVLCGILYWTLVTPVPPSPDRRQFGHERVTLTLSGRVVAPVQHGPGRIVALVEADTSLSQWGANADRRLIRLTWRDPDGTMYCGDRIEVHVTLSPPSGSLNPGGFDYAAYLERQGIGAVATVIGPGAIQLVGSGGGVWWGVWGQIDRWRATIREAAIHTLGQPTLGLFLGITIGERGYLQEDLQEWFMATGTVHLLSISGSHLGLIAVIVFAIVKRACVWLPTDMLLALSRTITPTRLAIVCTGPAVVFYALLAGAELATIRSLVMIMIALAVVWMGYERRLYHALAIAAMLIVLHDPRAIFDLSFQLSFLSVLVIVQLITWRGLSNGATEDEPKTIWKTSTSWCADALVVSGVVTLATVPVVASYFNQVPWMGVVTNLIAIPFTGFVLVPLGLLTGAWTLVFGSDGLPMGLIQERFMEWMVEGLRWCAGFSLSEWRVPAPSLPTMVVFYAALALVGLRRASILIRALAVTVVILMLGWWEWAPRLGLDGDRWRVTFLDVGQGDSAVIELPDGRTILMDGGAHYERFDMGRGVVAPFLWNRRIRRIDYVIGTHQQLDHVGGLAWVIRHMPVGQYWTTGVERPEQFATDLRDAVRERKLDEQIAVRGDELLSNGLCRLTIVNPAATGKAAPTETPLSGSYLNNHSIVSRLQCGARSLLFSADIEVEGLRRLAEEGRRAVTVLKVPHHGARNSLDRDWLRQINPQYAVVSVGAHNPYGHPSQPVLDAFGEEGILLYRTDHDGAVWVTGRVSTSELQVRRMQDLALRPTDPTRGLWPGELENWHRVWSQLIDA